MLTSASNEVDGERIKYHLGPHKKNLIAKNSSQADITIGGADGSVKGTVKVSSWNIK